MHVVEELIQDDRFYKENGAEGQNRTADTMIFSHVLYRLSYLGTSSVTKT